MTRKEPGLRLVFNMVASGLRLDRETAASVPREIEAEYQAGCLPADNAEPARRSCGYMLLGAVGCYTMDATRTTCTPQHRVCRKSETLLLVGMFGWTTAATSLALPDAVWPQPTAPICR